MSTTTTEPATSTEQATWVCDNCHGRAVTARKRCRDCGTSRY